MGYDRAVQLARRPGVSSWVGPASLAAVCKGEGAPRGGGSAVVWGIVYPSHGVDAVAHGTSRCDSIRAAMDGMPGVAWRANTS